MYCTSLFGLFGEMTLVIGPETIRGGKDKICFVFILIDDQNDSKVTGIVLW